MEGRLIPVPFKDTEQSDLKTLVSAEEMPFSRKFRPSEFTKLLELFFFPQLRYQEFSFYIL